MPHSAVDAKDDRRLRRRDLVAAVISARLLLQLLRMASQLSSSTQPTSALSSTSSSLASLLLSTGGQHSSASSADGWLTAAVCLVVAGGAAIFLLTCFCIFTRQIHPLARPQQTARQPAASGGGGGGAGTSGTFHSGVLQLVHLRIPDHGLPVSLAAESEGLSKEQLDALPASRWQHSDGALEEGDGERCTICLIDFDQVAVVTELRCSHTYHTACIRQWLSHKHTCPLCLTKLT